MPHLGYRERSREARRSYHDIPRKAQGAECLVYRIGCLCGMMHDHVPTRCIALGRYFASQGQVASTNRADKAIGEQRLHAHFWARLAEDPDLQVQRPVTQRAHVIVWLWRKPPAHPWSRLSYRRHKARSEHMHKCSIDAQRESPFQNGLSIS
jgi:hypothetical protein